MEFWRVYYMIWSMRDETCYEGMLINWSLSDVDDQLREMKSTTMLEF